MRAAIAGLLGLAWASGAQAQPVQQVDPAKILYTISTIAEDLAPIERPPATIGENEIAFHEDNWRQIEFLPFSRLGEAQKLLTDLVAFEKAHRVGAGWNAMFQRRLPPQLMLGGKGLFADFVKRLGGTSGPGAILYYGDRVPVGRVAGGFTIPLGGKISLYGVLDKDAITVLGADVPDGAEEVLLSDSFAKIWARYGFILVDWRSHMILIDARTDGRINVWRPAPAR